MKEVCTPLSLWKDIDFTLPFDEEVVSLREEEGVTVKKFYFTGRKVGELPSRVYAVCAYTKLPAPCLLIIGRIDRCVDIDFVKYWAKLGYCAVSIDYGGSMEQGAHTIYPPKIEYANFLLSNRHLTHVDETARQTAWFEYGFNSKRVIEYLFANGMVLEDKLALASYGDLSSTVAVHMLGTEKRIKTGIIMFGSIWEDGREISKLANIDEHDITQRVEEVEEEERYFAGICKQSYLQYVTQPIYLVCSANTWGTSLSQNFAAMSRCPNRNSKALFVPGYVDKAPKELFDQFHNWFDMIFDQAPLPKRPRIRLSSGKGGMSVSVDASKAHIYYSRKNEGEYLYWDTAETTETKSGLKANLVAFPDTQSLAVYATVYQDNLIMSSAISFVDLADYPEILRKNPDRILYSANLTESKFIPLLVNDKESYSPVDDVSKKKGPFGLKGISGSNFGTFAISEYPFNANSDSFMAFDAYSATPCSLCVKLVAGWSKPDRVIFTKTIKLSGGELWQKVKINLRDFKFENTVLLDNSLLSKLEVLCFECEENAFVNNILFG